MNAMKISYGFTLVELLVSVSIAIILMTMAVPGFQSTVQNSRAGALASEFISDTHLARSTAIKQGRTTSLCISNNQTSCQGSNWSDGWIVWADSDANGTLSSSEIIRVHESLSGNSTLAVTPALTSSFSYQPSGFLAGATPLTFQLRSPGCSGTNGRDMSISVTGRTHIERAAC